MEYPYPSPLPVTQTHNPIDLASIVIFAILSLACLAIVFRLFYLFRRQVFEFARDPGVAIAIVFTLVIAVGIFLPAIQQTRTPARRTVCRLNLMQISIGLHVYEEKHSRIPPSSTGSPPVSWRVNILPEVEWPDLFDKYDSTLSWDSPENEKVAQIDPYHYTCPSRAPETDRYGRYFTDYLMLTGQGTVGEHNTVVSSTGIPDGSSNTMVVIESSGQNVIWTEPRDVDVTKQKIGINLPGSKQGYSSGIGSSRHLECAMGLFADGQVSAISQDIDPRVLKAMTTIDGGEEIPADW